MSYEMEMKLPIRNADTIEMQLIGLGFDRKSHWNEVDTYFNSRFHDMRAWDQALRIRCSTNLETGEKKTQVNFKGSKLDHVSMSRRELETNVEDGNVMKDILIQLEYIPVAIVEKKRLYYTDGTTTACVDHVKDLGYFLELEILSPRKEARENCLRKMDEILQKLGYHGQDTVQKSYLSMLEEGRTVHNESSIVF